MYDYRNVVLLAYIFHKVDQKWRDRFVEICAQGGTVHLHRAWNRLRQEGFLWEFSNNFLFDSANEIFCALQYAMVCAIRDGIIKIEDGRLIVANEITIEFLVGLWKMDRDMLDRAAARLNEILEDQDRKPPD